MFQFLPVARMQHIPLYMPDLVSIEVVGKVQAGSRMKKYHILENSSSKYSFQKQVIAVFVKLTHSLRFDQA